ncbi:hypothetical protein [Streptomyces mirabilis]
MGGAVGGRLEHARQVDVEVFDFDLAAAAAECSGKEFGETTCAVLAACSLAYSELLPNINRSLLVCSSPHQAGDV